MIDSASAPPRLAWAASPDGRLRWRKRKDRLARWIVRIGGAATIASIVAILGFILYEVVPLWMPPGAALESRIDVGTGRPLVAASTDEYREMLSVVDAAGRIRFLDLQEGREEAVFAFPALDGETILAAAQPDDRYIVAATPTRLVAARLGVRVRHLEDGRRQLDPVVSAAGAWPLPEEVGRPRLVAASLPADGNLVALVVDVAGTTWLYAVREEASFLGDVERTTAVTRLAPAHGDVTTALVDADGTQIYLGTHRGRLERWSLADPAAPKRTDDVAAAVSPDAAITALRLLIGDESLVVGDAAGGIGVWFPVRAVGGAKALRRIHDFEPHPSAVTAVAASPRDRGFVTADASGGVRVHHATTERTLLTMDGGAPVRELVFAPRADGVVAIGAAGTAAHWRLDNPHPEISFRTLFGKVWYEGYDEPAYVWQSTGGTDAFEPKLSLVPLAFGTFKGTFYALLFAVPLAVLAALYTSQFSHPSVRATVKPIVEIMAALPSVVLGFLGGLWLAPRIEEFVPAVMVSLFVIPALIFAVALAVHGGPSRLRRMLSPAGEVLLLCALVLLGLQISLALNAPLENLLFGGDFRTWLHEVGGRFDQRNNIVVGIAMGFAVIPIIFTISEDALSNVPSRLVSASLALGATRWQTALKVVVPTASPGIFSAIMIGFGRAVGETMIVLMATGNTPVLDWSLFTGMRTLSANIAVEIPEAPHGATLYRVLFLAGLLLFLVTFLTNTAAELVRQRLRRRYQEI